MPHNRKEREQEVRNTFDFVVFDGEFSLLNGALAIVDGVVTGGTTTLAYIQSKLGDFGIKVTEKMIAAGVDPTSEPIYSDVMVFQNWETPFRGVKVYLPNKFVPYVAARKSKTPSLERYADRVVFDAAHYLASYADLRAAFATDHAAARQHWLDHGIREGRRSSSVFDVEYYLGEYRDLQKAFGTDYQSAIHHWQDYGIAEGRRASAAFDVSHYLNLYPDLQQAFGPTNYASALDHWLEYGMQEGRKSAKNFEVRYYLDRNPDLQKAFGSDNYPAAVDHWLIHGLAEGRSGAP